MVFTPRGNHLIAGAWTRAKTPSSDPAHGPAHVFAVGSLTLIDQAAEVAFPTYAATSREDRVRFLEAIADEIEASAEAVTEIGCPRHRA